MTNRRSSICIAVAMLCAMAFTLSCNSRSDGGPTAPPPPPPPPMWTSLVGRSVTALPGADGSYLCTQIQVSSDLYIKGFRTTASAGVFRMYLTVSDTVPSANVPATLGDFPCSGGVLADRALYVGGVGTPDFEFPAGVGVHVKAGQYLLLTVEEYNPTAASESGTAGVSFEAGTAADVTQNADVLVAGTRSFILPTGNSRTSGGCSEPDNIQIVGLFPVMNLAGVRQRIRIATGPTAVTIQDTTYTATHMVHTLVQPAYAVHTNDQIIVECSYDNTTGAVIASGDNVTTEACYNWMYRYPAPASANSFDCIS